MVQGTDSCCHSLLTVMGCYCVVHFLTADMGKCHVIFYFTRKGKERYGRTASSYNTLFCPKSCGNCFSHVSKFYCLGQGALLMMIPYLACYPIKNHKARCSGPEEWKDKMGKFHPSDLILPVSTLRPRLGAISPAGLGKGAGVVHADVAGSLLPSSH